MKGAEKTHDFEPDSHWSADSDAATFVCLSQLDFSSSSYCSVFACRSALRARTQSGSASALSADLFPFFFHRACSHVRASAQSFFLSARLCDRRPASVRRRHRLLWRPRTATTKQATADPAAAAGSTTPSRGSAARERHVRIARPHRQSPVAQALSAADRIQTVAAARKAPPLRALGHAADARTIAAAATATKAATAAASASGIDPAYDGTARRAYDHSRDGHRCFAHPTVGGGRPAPAGRQDLWTTAGAGEAPCSATTTTADPPCSNAAHDRARVGCRAAETRTITCDRTGPTTGGANGTIGDALGCVAVAFSPPSRRPEQRRPPTGATCASSDAACSCASGRGQRVARRGCDRCRRCADAQAHAGDRSIYSRAAASVAAAAPFGHNADVATSRSSDGTSTPADACHRGRRASVRRRRHIQWRGRRRGAVGQVAFSWHAIDGAGHTQTTIDDVIAIIAIAT